MYYDESDVNHHRAVDLGTSLNKILKPDAARYWFLLYTTGFRDFRNFEEATYKSAGFDDKLALESFGPEAHPLMHFFVQWEIGKLRQLTSISIQEIFRSIEECSQLVSKWSFSL